MSARRSVRGLLRGVAVVALVAASCGDDGGGDAEASPATGSSTPQATATTTTAAPRTGGTLTIGVFSQITGVDPILTRASGSTGGDELGAVYDRLVQWNPVTKSYDPKTAESVTSNAAFTEWTIKVRPGIVFGDGTAYDAVAVKFNIDRQRTESAGSRGLLAIIASVDVVDPLTVKVTLKEPWALFQFELSNSLGMIVSPTAVQKLGKDFAVNPVGAGAGPFQVVSFLPNEGLVLKRNPNYWGGQVYLDGLKFVLLAGASAYLDGMKTGSVDVAHLREPAVVAQSKTDGLGGIETIFSLGEILLVNNGVEVTCAKEQPAKWCAAKADGTKVATLSPGSDPTVRKAIAAAIDVNVMDARANDGKGIPAANVLDTSFPWDPKVAMPKANLDTAKRLVGEAKAKGWDGKLRLTCSNSPQRVAMGVTIETQLRAAGIEVDMTKTNQAITQVTADVITAKDYDLACWGLPMSPDDGAQTSLESFLRGSSASNRTGYKSASMDAALDDLKKASTNEAKSAAYKKLADQWVIDVPSVPLSAVNERVAFAKRVNGLVGTSFASVVFDKAWVNA